MPVEPEDGWNVALLNLRTDLQEKLKQLQEEARQVEQLLILVRLKLKEGGVD